MRGRVNTGEGVALNANTVNKILASGQVTAGDFVEYYKNNSIIEQSGYNFFIGNIGEYTVTIFSNNYNYHQYGGSVKLFKQGEQISSYLGYQVREATIYANFIIFHAQGIIGALKINSNEQLELIDSITLSQNFQNIFYIAAGNNKICAFYSNTSGTSAGAFKFVICDISVEGLISHANEQIIDHSSMGYDDMVLFNNYNNLFYILGGPSRKVYSYLHSVELDNENNVTIGPQMTTVFPGKKRYQNGDLLVLSQESAGLAVITISTGAFITINLPNDTQSSNIENGLFVACKTSNNISTIYLYYFDEANKEIEMLSETIINKYVDCDWDRANFMLNGDILYLSISDYDLEVLDIVGSEMKRVQERVNPEYAVPYTGLGYPIGIAKTNGNVGDTIPVFIPTPSA